MNQYIFIKNEQELLELQREQSNRLFGILPNKTIIAVKGQDKIDHISPNQFCGIFRVSKKELKVILNVSNETDGSETPTEEAKSVNNSDEKAEILKEEPAEDTSDEGEVSETESINISVESEELSSVTEPVIEVEESSASLEVFKEPGKRRRIRDLEERVANLEKALELLIQDVLTRKKGK